MESMENRRKFRQWIKTQTRRFIRETEMEVGGPVETRLINHWEENRPKMYRRLKQLHLLTETAYVMMNMAWEAEKKYKKAGMSYPDAKQQAEQDWLMLEQEPEVQEQEEAEAESNPMVSLGRMLEQAQELRIQAATTFPGK